MYVHNHVAAVFAHTWTLQNLSKKIFFKEMAMAKYAGEKIPVDVWKCPSPKYILTYATYVHKLETFICNIQYYCSLEFQYAIAKTLSNDKIK